jgi:hypothetical protein
MFQMENTIFWGVTPCSLVEVRRCLCEMSVNFYQTAQCHIPEVHFTVTPVITSNLMFQMKVIDHKYYMGIYYILFMNI